MIPLSGITVKRAREFLGHREIAKYQLAYLDRNYIGPAPFAHRYGYAHYGTLALTSTIGLNLRILPYGALNSDEYPLEATIEQYAHDAKLVTSAPCSMSTLFPHNSYTSSGPNAILTPWIISRVYGVFGALDIEYRSRAYTQIAIPHKRLEDEYTDQRRRHSGLSVRHESATAVHAFHCISFFHYDDPSTPHRLSDVAIARKSWVHTYIATPIDRSKLEFEWFDTVEQYEQCDWQCIQVSLEDNMSGDIFPDLTRSQEMFLAILRMNAER